MRCRPVPGGLDTQTPGRVLGTLPGCDCLPARGDRYLRQPAGAKGHRSLPAHGIWPTETTRG
jgi:hypothetical protein